VSACFYALVGTFLPCQPAPTQCEACQDASDASQNFFFGGCTSPSQPRSHVAQTMLALVVESASIHAVIWSSPTRSQFRITGPGVLQTQVVPHNWQHSRAIHWRASMVAIHRRLTESGLKMVLTEKCLAAHSPGLSVSHVSEWLYPSLPSGMRHRHGQGLQACSWEMAPTSSCIRMGHGRHQLMVL
jgi:hypothetical protein